MTNKGFTLIETMITILIFSLVISAVYATHTVQQNTYRAQEQVADMQQSLRAAFTLLRSDIRTAGYDPTQSGLFGITTAQPGRLSFTRDLDKDGAIGGTKETIDIGFPVAVDGDDDGIPDSANVDTIGRQYNNAGGYQALANNIQAMEFRYLDSAGAVTATLTDIRSVQLTILVRAGVSDSKYSNTTTYTTPGLQVWGPYNDNSRRRMLTTTIRCRNL